MLTSSPAFGVEPSRIDILTEISGVIFSDAWERKMSIEMNGCSMSVIGLEDLIKNKAHPAFRGGQASSRSTRD